MIFLNLVCGVVITVVLVVIYVFVEIVVLKVDRESSKAMKRIIQKINLPVLVIDKIRLKNKPLVFSIMVDDEIVQSTTNAFVTSTTTCNGKDYGQVTIEYNLN